MPELLMNAEIPADVPEWIMIARTGTWRGHPTAGTESVTAEDLASALGYFDDHYAANGVDLVIDYHHASVAAALRGGRAPAAGWIQQMELRAGGAELWGRVLWTTDAVNAIGAREFRYLSPVFSFDRPDRVTGKPVPMQILSVALTNTPFLMELQALNANAPAGGVDDVSSRGGKSMKLLSLIAMALALSAEQVASQLGLKDAQEDADVANAIMGFVTRSTELEAQAGKLPEFVANSIGVPPDAEETAVRAALLKLRIPGAGMAQVRIKLGLADDAADDQVLNSIGALQDVKRTSEAEELVDAAVAAGKVAPSMRDMFLREAQQDLEAARQVINSLATITQSSGLDGRDTGKGPVLSETDSKVAEMLGHDPKEFAEFLAAERA